MQTISIYYYPITISSKILTKLLVTSLQFLYFNKSIFFQMTQIVEEGEGDSSRPMFFNSPMHPHPEKVLMKTSLPRIAHHQEVNMIY